MNFNTSASQKSQTSQPKVCIPIPHQDFDPSEVAVTWHELSQSSISVTFFTPDGQQGSADSRMVTGKGLGPLKPLLVADSNALNNYRKLLSSHEFTHPKPWNEINVNDFDGIVLPGGHAKGMIPYLESEILQKRIAEFFNSKKLVAAICHGTVLVARSKRPDGKSVLFDYKTTSLLKSQEMAAWALTCLWLGNYYRTYPISVQEEITQNLENSSQFIPGPLPTFRDSPQNLKPGFVVEDRNYISARWPGDVHRFSQAIIEYFKRK